MRALGLAALALLAPAVARADIAPECQSVGRAPDYDEQVQQDFLQNWPALGLTFSPIHGPMPHEGGRGALGIDLDLLPPLSCDQRLVFNASKTQDTNFAPVIPKLRGTVALPRLPGNTIVYLGAAYIPPVQVFGQRTSMVSGEVGFGGAWIKSVPALQFGLRGHATTFKLVADVAKAFDEDEDPAVLDMYVGSSFGGDVLIGYALPWFTPYVAAGYTDVSTFFYIGDDGVVTNNLHPYSGFTFSAGLDGLAWNHFRWAVEFYGAPGGYSLPDDSIESVEPASRYGHIYTARTRLAYEF